MYVMSNLINKSETDYIKFEMWYIRICENQ